LRTWSYKEAAQVFPRSHRARRAWSAELPASTARSGQPSNRSQPKIGCTPETLHIWVRQQERDTDQRPGPTTAEEERIKALERENRELRKTNEVLRLASPFFAQAELDRRFKS
jgi:transposase-like protein